MSTISPTSRPVVIITGAAGAIGSELTLQFAKIGASLLIQDIPLAEPGLKQLVTQVQSIYKQAPANKYQGTPAIHYSTIDIIASPAWLITFAIEKFAYITTLINNAGYLQDTSFTKQTQQQWDDIIDIHLTTPRNLIAAAWPHFTQQKFGRVINVTSHAGICGNFGQTNYSAAKAGILGLTRSLALEGVKSNITVNAIAPFAQSKMTKGSFPDELLAPFHPKEIAPVVVFLTTGHDQSQAAKPITGEVVQCGGGYLTKTSTFTPQGIVFDTKATSIDAQVTQIAQQWGRLESTISKANTNNKGQFIASTNGKELIGNMISSIAAGPSKVSSPSPPTPPPTPSPAPSTTNHKQTNTNTTTQPPSPAASSAGPTPLGFDLMADTIVLGLTPHLDAQVVKEGGIVIGFEILPGLPASKKPNSNGAQPPPPQTPPAAQKRQFTIDLKNNSGGIVWNALTSTTGAKPDAVLIIHDGIFVKLFLQEVEAQNLYLTGKLKVRGDLAKAMKFEQVLKSFENKVNVRDLVGAKANL